MNINWRSIIWQQFGAAIDLLDSAIRAWPDELWREPMWDDPTDPPEYTEFWYIAFHTLAWLDLYLTGDYEGFKPPAPFVRGRLPEQPYTRDEILTYLDFCRQKCRATLEALTDETALRPFRFPWNGVEISFTELLLYTMRHVQEHAAQFSLMLGQRTGSAPEDQTFYVHDHRSHEMNIPWRTILWRQFGAAIDMLDNAIDACPDELWQQPLWPNTTRWPGFSQFWYVVYHALFWLDLYLTGAEEGFAPPAPFTLIEQDDEGPMPERPYTKEELQSYLDECRRRCRTTIEALTDEAAQRLCRFGWGEVSFVELQIYSMRHVQEHAAQLSLFIGQQGAPAPDWVAWASEGAGKEAG